MQASKGVTVKTVGRLSAALGWIGSRFDYTYVRNRLVYLSLQQPAFIGEELPESGERREIYPRDQCIPWDLSALPQGRASLNPHQPGLWAVPGALSPAECTSIVAAITSLTAGDAVQGVNGVPVRGPAAKPLPQNVAMSDASSVWEWFEYGHARRMVPLQPSCGINTSFALGPLSLLQSHNSTDARCWPLLASIPGDGGEALRAVERLPLELIPDISGRPPLFLQLQALQRGACVGAHVDEADVGGRAIATVVIYGGSEVRVGGTSFTVRPGDMYALTGEARDEIDHEVYAGQDDRLSITVRYGELLG